MKITKEEFLKAIDALMSHHKERMAVTGYLNSFQGGSSHLVFGSRFVDAFIDTLAAASEDPDGKIANWFFGKWIKGDNTVTPEHLYAQLYYKRVSKILPENEYVSGSKSVTGKDEDEIVDWGPQRDYAYTNTPGNFIADFEIKLNNLVFEVGDHIETTFKDPDSVDTITYGFEVKDIALKNHKAVYTLHPYRANWTSEKHNVWPPMNFTIKAGQEFTLKSKRKTTNG